MRLFAVTLMLLLCGSAFAENQPETPYRDAVLVSFRTVYTGSDCTSDGTVKGKADDEGNVSGTSSSTTSCLDSETRQYTVRVGENTFVLEDAFTGKEAAKDASVVIMTMGYGALFMRHHSVLLNQLPGAHILIRSHGNGFQVKVGKKQSNYRVVEAQ